MNTDGDADNGDSKEPNPPTTSSAAATTSASAASVNLGSPLAENVSPTFMSLRSGKKKRRRRSSVTPRTPSSRRRSRQSTEPSSSNTNTGKTAGLLDFAESDYESESDVEDLRESKRSKTDTSNDDDDVKLPTVGEAPDEEQEEEQEDTVEEDAQKPAAEADTTMEETIVTGVNNILTEINDTMKATITTLETMEHEIISPPIFPTTTTLPTNLNLQLPVQSPTALNSSNDNDAGTGTYRGTARLRNFLTPAKPNPTVRETVIAPPETPFPEPNEHDDEQVGDDDEGLVGRGGRASGRRDGLVSSLVRQTSLVVLDTFAETGQIARFAQCLVHPFVQRRPEGETTAPMERVDTSSRNENEEDPEKETTETQETLYKTWSMSHWMVLFVVLHTVTSSFTSITPLWTKIAHHGEFLSNVYGIQRVIPTIVEETREEIVQEEEIITPPPIVETKIVKVVEWVEDESLEEEEFTRRRKRKTIEEYEKRVKDVEMTRKDYQSVLDAYETGDMNQELVEEVVAQLDHGIEEQEEVVDDWSLSLEFAQEKMDGLNDSHSPEELDMAAQEAREALQTLKGDSLAPILESDYKLFLAENVRVPGEGCEGKGHIFYNALKQNNDVPSSKGSQSLERAHVYEAKEQLVNLASLTVQNAAKDGKMMESIQSWASEVIEEIEDTMISDDIPEVDTLKLNLNKYDSPPQENISVGLSQTEVQSIIDKRLEKEMADLTGEFDYASAQSGGTVIHSGPQRTSLSLVDNMPLLNKFLSWTKLRFYGYGPDIALIPTYPKTALGQCWSFEKEGSRQRIGIITDMERSEDEERENNPIRGEFATFAVTLAKPTRVHSILLEHPPKELSPNRGSSIRDFRIFGFEESDADGDPFLLGSFSYDEKGERSLQEFDVEIEDSEGHKIPKLSSIVVAIDSNWGAAYSCLYRFRVHGT